MGEAEATAAKSTNASDAAREPAAEEEGTAPVASGVCGKREIQSYDSLQDEILHSCISFIFIGEFSRDSENP